jgi:hypothetical protein
LLAFSEPTYHKPIIVFGSSAIVLHGGDLGRKIADLDIFVSEATWVDPFQARPKRSLSRQKLKWNFHYRREAAAQREDDICRAYRHREGNRLRGKCHSGSPARSGGDSIRGQLLRLRLNGLLGFDFTFSGSRKNRSIST